MNAYDTVTERILAQLDKGIIPWKRGFDVTGPSTPTNYLTKKEYRGINVFMLFCNDYPTSEWMTYKQAQELGTQVRKGERSTPVIYWNVCKEESEPAADDKRESYVFCKTYSVFNVAQMDGITPVLPFAGRPFEPIPAAAELAAAYLQHGPALAHGGNQPFYSPSRDLVQMPECEKWHSSERYYKTLFHELGHSTGHQSRLNRDFGKHFGSDLYAKEELIAEFTTAFLCAACWLSSEDTELNAVAYIQNWIAALKNDKRLAVSAAQKAQKAADLIRGTSYAQTQPEALAA